MHLGSAIEIQAFQEHDVAFITYKAVEYAVEAGQHPFLAVQIGQIPARHVVNLFMDDHPFLPDELIETAFARLEGI